MNHIFRKTICSVIVGASVSAVAILGFTGVLRQRYKGNEYADWMATLDDNTSLRDVQMPGSHDSGALISIADLAGQCQSLSVLDQLNLGVRFLDIRLQQEEQFLRVVHGIVDQRKRFDDINLAVNTFLENHPREFIIMSIKEEADPIQPKCSFDECLKERLSDRYILSRELPSRMGDVRGKVVILSRYAGASIGVDAYGEWQDSCSFTMASSDIYIQDKYKISDASEKQNEIIKCFNETGHALKINFLSAYRTNSFPPSYAPSAAHDINPWVNKEIHNYHDRNIVLYDFVTKENMDAFFKEVL